jgi:hypothetical protein
MSRPPLAGQPAILPTTAAPEPGRTPASDKPLANGRPRTLPTGDPSAPPWQHSASLGGDFYYDPRTDEVVLRDGRRFPRPRQVPRHALQSVEWVGTLPFQYFGSPPTGHLPQPPWTNSTSFQYSSSPPTSHTSQQPRQVPRHTLQSATWIDRNRDPSPNSGGSREQTEPTDRSHPRSMDPAAGTQMQRLTSKKEPTVVFTRDKAQERSALQVTSSGGIDSLPIRVAPPSTHEELFPDYKIRKSGFYKTGRVFLVIWSEPAGGSSTVTGRQPGVVINHLGARVFSKIRRFVVIRESESYCNALPINTYAGKGVAKHGVKKSEHAIIYTGRTAPRVRTDELPGRREPGMQPIPIRVDPDNFDEQLDPMSRIDLGGVTKIQHNIKVKSLGLVNSASISALHLQFRAVWGMPRNPSIQKGRNPRNDRRGKDHSKFDDSEVEDDDEDDDDVDSDDGDESEGEEREFGEEGEIEAEEGRKGGGGREEEEQISDWTISIRHEGSEPNGHMARTK